MARINIGRIFKVEVWEYERGWGAKLDEVLHFDNETEAKEFVNRYNSKNTEKVAPDWYMVAQYCGELK